MTDFAIDRGVPPPRDYFRRGRRPKYPWDDLEVGDSFLLPGVKSAGHQGMVSWANNQKAPKRFISAVIPEGLRIWRVK